MAKKIITITLHMSELIYDVQNKTYLTGLSRKDGSNDEYVAHMQNNDDDEHSNQVLRTIGSAFAALKGRLGEYLVDSATTGNNEQISKNGTLVVSLNMPSNYNQAENDAVSAAMHQFIVNMAVGDWFTITNKADAGDYYQFAANNLGQLREAINRRVRPTRVQI